MSEPKYVMYADRPAYTRVPWWAWLVGAGLLVLWLGKRRGGDTSRSS